MTLLEVLVALVILGLTSLGFLGGFQSSARSTRDAEEWVSAVDYAEAAMEETKLGGEDVNGTALPDGFSQRVVVEPWGAVPGVDRLTVTVTMPRGGSFVLQRLARSR